MTVCRRSCESTRASRSPCPATRAYAPTQTSPSTTSTPCERSFLFVFTPQPARSTMANVRTTRRGEHGSCFGRLQRRRTSQGPRAAWVRRGCGVGAARVRRSVLAATHSPARVCGLVPCRWEKLAMGVNGTGATIAIQLEIGQGVAQASHALERHCTSGARSAAERFNVKRHQCHWQRVIFVITSTHRRVLRAYMGRTCRQGSQRNQVDRHQTLLSGLHCKVIDVARRGWVHGVAHGNRIDRHSAMNRLPFRRRTAT